MFTLHPQSSTPLVTQIVDGFRQLIEAKSLRVGARVPSVRQFAAAHEVSVFTVVEAYDRLVAQGWLVSRPNQGFFVKTRVVADARVGPAETPGFSFDSMWYLRKIFENRALAMKPGCGWLPQDWLFNDGLKRALRHVGSENIDLAGYGDPKGYLDLRRLISEQLAEHEIAATPAQVLLTHGSSQGLDLAARRLVRPGDAVLVDEPGYSNMLFMLRLQGARLVGVPRTAGGYDLDALEAAIVEHAPRAFFTQPRLQSPTGSIATLAQLHRVLQLCEKHDITIVENDIYADLDPEPRASLASLDQLRRVIHISSFSKTISPNIRVGHLVAHPDLIEDLGQLKMLAGLTSSELNERLAFGALTDSRWRRHLKALRERLAQAQQRVAQRLVDIGFELFAEPGCGLYLWARHPDIADSAEVSNKAAESDIMLGPGHLFLTDLRPTGWLRFNVAFCDDERVFAFFEQQRGAV
jgi:DNA-binding transcriptional MocR family regulator